MAVGRPIFSPDSQRVAYVAGAGGKWVVVVDGKEGKQYDRIGLDSHSLIFSPDSRRVAYIAKVGDTWFNNWFVVADGTEGKRYDSLIGRLAWEPEPAGRIIFDSPDSLHYLAKKGNGIYLVGEDKVKRVRLTVEEFPESREHG